MSDILTWFTKFSRQHPQQTSIVALAVKVDGHVLKAPKMRQQFIYWIFLHCDVLGSEDFKLF